jgi:hypothetical protein
MQPSLTVTAICFKVMTLPCAAADAPTSPSESSSSSASNLDAATTAPSAPAVPATRLVAAGAVEPHPNKKDKGGEDAHFVLESLAFGVADGVGGWAAAGIDPAEYSKQLMSYTKEALGKGRRRRGCVEALRYAHERVHVEGSCTAIVAKCASKMSLLVTQ